MAQLSRRYRWQGKRKSDAPFSSANFMHCAWRTCCNINSHRSTPSPQFPRTAFLPYHTNMASLIVLAIVSLFDIFFASLALVHLRKARHEALRLFGFYKMLSLAIYIWIFLLTTAWVGSEVIIWLIYIGFNIVCIWSSLTLALALLRGPQEAVGAGFSRDLVRMMHA
jgi:hypothetical protein